VSTDIITAINQSMMTPFKYGPILICTAALTPKGYDFAPKFPSQMPCIPASFFENDAQGGIRLGATPFGMALGSFLADKLGRRSLLLGTLLDLVAAMAGTGLVTDVPQLVVVRVITGAASAPAVVA
jgi:MFS family permease